MRYLNKRRWAHIKNLAESAMWKIFGVACFVLLLAFTMALGSHLLVQILENLQKLGVL